MDTQTTFDLAIIGGGPAGTSAAITSARAGARVLLLERGRLPRQRVCGEFVSSESIGLLGDLLNTSELRSRSAYPRSPALLRRPRSHHSDPAPSREHRPARSRCCPLERRTERCRNRTSANCGREHRRLRTFFTFHLSRTVPSARRHQCHGPLVELAYSFRPAAGQRQPLQMDRREGTLLRGAATPLSRSLFFRWRILRNTTSHACRKQPQ